jgi:hypothetical protein
VGEGENGGCRVNSENSNRVYSLIREWFTKGEPPDVFDVEDFIEALANCLEPVCQNVAFGEEVEWSIRVKP